MKPLDDSNLGVQVDLAGCPNRCRHCWLGVHKNGNLDAADFRAIAEQFRGWRDENGKGIETPRFWSWWREPDYREDYRALWTLEKELSAPGKAERFELLSTWRLARDVSYGPWAAEIGTKACQITFFGLEESTDWGMRRRGAFCDQLLATERCLDAGILPRWQLFLLKRNLGELEEFEKLMREMDLQRRCEALGGKFEFFFGGISPEGCGWELEEERLEADDLARIPTELIRLSRDGLRLLGRPEAELVRELGAIEAPARVPDVGVISVDAELDVYPNLAEPAPWWRLGNLRRDGVDAVLRAWRDGTTPGMQANETVPLAELVRQFGKPESRKLYSPGDFVCRLLHQWGASYIASK